MLCLNKIETKSKAKPSIFTIQQQHIKMISSNSLSLVFEEVEKIYWLFDSQKVSIKVRL